MNRFFRCAPRIGPAGSFEPADRAHRHIVVAHDLTGQAHSGQLSLFESLLLSRRHRRRLSVDEFNAARRAARISAARMQDVDVCVLLDRQHEALAIGNVKRSITFNRQFGHLHILHTSTQNLRARHLELQF